MKELTLTGVSKRFGGNQVIPDLSMHVKPGRATALVGPNGAGKTTIFNLITGFLRPDTGQVQLGDQVISHVAPHRILKLGIGRTFQEMRLFEDLTVLENLQIAREQAGLRPWRSPARLAIEFGELLERFGLDHARTSPARDLAYAERKFLSLARVISSGAELFLLDEPTSGLDDHSLEVVMQVIGDLTAEGHTVLIIEHNLDVVRGIADEIMFLQGGNLIAQGAPAEIFARADLSEIYFGVSEAGE
jgi:branched-chain amino acid transport system ATP-binding protein